MSDSIPPTVERQLDEEAPIAPVDAGMPMYAVDPVTKIAVSKQYGKLWKGRLDAAERARKMHEDAWDECIRYYNNSQDGNRIAADNKSGNRYFSARRNAQWSETENVVYANTRAIMPALYAKNPQVEFTAFNEGRKPYVDMLERLVNTLANTREAPGLNLKVHARQAVLTTELCNLAWIEYGYVEKPQSSILAEQTIAELSQQLADAQDTKTIREIEGKLLALEEQLDLLNPPGPYARFRSPHDVVVDGDSSIPDFSDAKWLAVREFYPTAYLNARYSTDDEHGVKRSIYEPTHVLSGGESLDDEIKSFKLFSHDAEASAYGYTDSVQVKRAHRTLCWRIYDRTTRRVYLYADNKWDWPVWVENDPYGLPGFFNFEPLFFNTTPLGALARSNVTYYLDQQDAINEIHDEFRRARQDIKENILYDSRFNRDTVLDWLRGSSPSAFGVDVPDGRTLKDMILEKPNSLLRAQALFDLGRPMQSVDRISGVSDILRNAQFKTNTTNKAIESYHSSSAQRLDEKIDAIEDFLGRVFYGVAFCCAQFMPADQVAMLIGDEAAAQWQTHTAQELRGMFACSAVGGSTQKPSSNAKREYALELGNLLSKLAQYAPSVVLETTMQLFDNAFDELHMPHNAFLRIEEEAKAALQRGNSTQGAGGDAAPSGNSAMAPSMEEVAAVVDTLPPEAKIALGNALAAGAPVSEALPEVIRMIGGGAQ